MHIFTPNHVALIAACYPPASALLASGPDYRPKSQELSRLTYYAANHPGKINKLGAELEKRARADCSKAVAGNPRARASLLITLAIVRTLAIECRRDISLLSPSLVSCLRTTLDFMSPDLEVCALAASVFTAWCTYTDGHVIGVDGGLTQNYLVVVKQFSAQCNAERKSFDDELKNRFVSSIPNEYLIQYPYRTQLVGLSAVAGVVNSEALYISATQFKAQALSLTSALLPHIIYADMKILAECEQVTKDITDSMYLAEFRSRPLNERRAASIHAHVDGEAGPSSTDVLSTSIRALSQLFKHSNAAQVCSLIQSAFETLDAMRLWAMADQCRWFAQRACDWAQYQYRYAIPSRVVERLLEAPDAPVCTSEQKTLIGMLTTVFTSPTPLVNLSTSDIVSNLITLVFRRVVANPNDDLLPLLVESIASLGARVYYSDQIQDLASELASRLTTIDTQSSVNQRRESRSQAIRCLLAGLLGLMLASDEHKGCKSNDQPHSSLHGTSTSPSDTFARVSQRTKVSGEIWYDTLTLLCDNDFAVRSDYAQALVTYLRCEIPKVDVDRVRRPRNLAGGSPSTRANSISLMLFGDSATRSLHAIHAYLFLLATSSYLGSSLGISVPSSYSLNGDVTTTGTTSIGETEGNPPLSSDSADVLSSSPSRRRSIDPAARSRKSSHACRLLDTVTGKVSSSCLASHSDYALILHVLTAIHEEVPVRGLLTGFPMLAALEAAAQVEDGADAGTWRRAFAMKEVLARLWLVIGRVWSCSELVCRVENDLSTLNGHVTLPQIAPFTPGALRPPEAQIPFPDLPETKLPYEWSVIKSEEVLVLLASSKSVQEATALDQQGLIRKLSPKWTVEGALRDSAERPNHNRPLGDGVPPLLKLSPALMAIENLSLQSLTRSVRGVGVTDLRDALEGRAGASNPTLARQPSMSTLDHSLSHEFHPTRHAFAPDKARSKRRAVTTGSGEVRDVLNRLGIGKYSGNSLLKASFPSMHKSDQK
ncbi:hypothetical protein EDC04DRAFT_3102476 [Pisolithus marmoratus]|nr:hypothetical protein EDC04DRAFT_3102476 [Pisolithus marmoratus]